MGVEPEVSFSEETMTKKKSLKVVGTMVLASVRMKKAAEGWAEKRKVQESLVRAAERVANGKGKGRKTVAR
jgi:hypothetical protein